MDHSLSRRTFLGTTAAATAALSAGLAPLPLTSPSKALPEPTSQRKRALRVAHMTDFHIQPELAADQGSTAAFHHMQALADRPELVLTGGDHVMDTFEHDFDRSKALWDLWTKIRKDHCSLAIESAIGNHDIWGWNKSKSKTTGTEKTWGKSWALEMLGLSAPYRSFDRAGWHFIILDTVHVDPADANGYIGALDEPQFAWLEADLAKLDPKTPVLVLTHIPIFCASAMFESSDVDQATHRVSLSGGEVMTDMRRIITLFKKHPNVKVCISGHIHLVDRIDYNGVSYLCNGAISGNWWKGRHKTCDEGYAILDLYDDGTFDNHYQTYGWQAKK